MKQFVTLHPTKEGKRKWRYKAIVIDLRLYAGAASHPDCRMYAKDVLVGEIKSSKLFIYDPYAWNGSTPKYYVGWPPFGFWVGTPDFESTIVASGGHDILFQFSALLQFTMEEVNYCFYRWIEEAGGGELVRSIYYGAVSELGHDYWGKKDSTLRVEYA